MDFALVAFGLGVGILVGMTGIGGGSLMTPMLILVFGVTPTTAIGTDLAYAAVTKTVGGYKHWKQRTVDLELSTWMAIGSVPAAVFGVYVLTLLEDWLGSDFEDTVIVLLAGALLLTGTATLVRALLKRMQAARARHDRDGAAPQDRRRGARRLGRLRARRDLGGQRRADRRRADPPLQADAAARGGHRRLPRGDPPVGGRAVARGRRQRGLRPRGHDPARLRPGRLARQPLVGAGGSGGAPRSRSPWC